MISGDSLFTIVPVFLHFLADFIICVCEFDF